jgi:hypothetical protein
MYHYIDKNSQAQGPVSLEQLETLLTAGIVQSTTLVAKPGDPGWIPLQRLIAQTSYGRFAKSSLEIQHMPQNTATSPVSVHPQGNYNSAFEGMLKGFYTRPAAANDLDGRSAKAFLHSVLRAINSILQGVILIVGLVLVLLLLAVAVRFEKAPLFFAAIGFLPVAFLFQYVVASFATANIKLIDGPPIKLLTPLIPNILVVLGTLAWLAIAVLLFGWPIFWPSRSLESVLHALVLAGIAAGVSFFVAWLCANCRSMLNVEFVSESEQNAFDYFCNLLRFLLRALLACVPLATLICALVSLAAIFILGSQLLQADNWLQIAMLGLGGTLAGTLLLATFLLPITAHFTYISLVSLSELVSGFFRLVDSAQASAKAAINEKTNGGGRG